MKKTISLVGVISLIILGGSLLVMGSYLVFEPEEVKSAEVATSTVTVTLTVDEEVSLTAPDTITMSPNITATDNSSIGGTSTSPWLVKTNAALGYTLELHATTTPALQSVAHSFTDATTTSPITWGFSAGQACAGTTTCFGFSVFGTDTASSTWGNSDNCGSGGTPNAILNYRGFEGTSPKITVATRNGVTPIAGIGTTMCVVAAQDTDYAPSGTYSTVITGTATTQ